MSEPTIEHIAIEHECAKLVTRFANANDSGDYRALADCFTEDGAFARPTDPANPIKGRETIYERFLKKPKEMLTVHLISNIEIEVLSRDEATGFSLVTLFTGTRAEGAKLPIPAHAQALLGSFKSRFKRTSAGWRIAEHNGALSLSAGSK